MFTGIIEEVATVINVVEEGSNLHIDMQSEITPELKIDQSVAHNGVCLTVIKIVGNNYTVTAIDETLNRTNIGGLSSGDKVNLERCMKLGARLDGHMVQGHVDTTAVCSNIEDLDGSIKFHFNYNPSEKNITVEKGSICINGVSLTVVDSGDSSFSVCIIPFTLEHTNFHTFIVGSIVNIEFDIIGKYLEKMNRR